MSELFDTSGYSSSVKVTSSFQVKGKAKPEKQIAVDPSWDEPDFDWQPGDIARIVDENQGTTTVHVERTKGDRVTISFPDYKEGKVVEREIKSNKLIATEQTHQRREAWKLAPILLEKLGGGRKRSHELATELGISLGQTSQCLEKLERDKKVCHCDNWIYSLAQGEDLPSPEPSSDCSSPESQMMTNSVQTSCEKDFPELRTTGESANGLTGKNCQTQTSGQQVHHANPSVLEENAKEGSTAGMDSPLCLGELSNANLESSALRTSPDYSTALTFQEANSSTFPGSSKGYAASGTMQNGKLCQAPHSVRRGKEKDSSWLPTPTALSSQSRGPGLMKLEHYLREAGAIACNQVVNPVLLEVGMGLPIGWTNPRVPNTALELLREIPKPETGEKPSEMLSTTQSPSQRCKPASDSWNANHLGQDKRQAEDDDQMTIFYDYSDEPPLPEKCKNLEEFEQKWAEWEARFPELSGKILEEVEAPRATEIPQILLEKAQLEIEENLDEDELYSLVSPVEIVEQEEWEKPYTATPREPKGYAKGQTGQLYSYGQRKKSSFLNADSHYYWGYSYQAWDGFKWRSKSKSVPLSKLPRVREAIAAKLLVEDILRILEK